MAARSSSFIIPAVNQLTPEPEAGDLGEWQHIAYGGNKRELDGTFGHTVWTPDGGIHLPTAADYQALRSLRRQWATLVTPWGSFTAYLAEMSGVRPYVIDGLVVVSARGPVRWEWA